jgi:hypothetical protein
VQLVVLVLAALFARVPALHEPTPIQVLQHRIEDVSDRVQTALADLSAARTDAEKSRANAQLVDLRLELADLSDRVRVQSQR